ncbi:hypothetical protein H072_7241 [Dactylellina haptotyla CBS 200.50]|uniref:Major facilitator superfamily (MFS) profile domain-containing protein n=1 Tax=Dactylellina haptotyla (strain CBS 200.50) TaxID=1284197 RepID=S8A834_DACHA|nr:hypothetical protein H072_7241 [Dactylellina haptotyla CBS 200.50]
MAINLSQGGNFDAEMGRPELEKLGGTRTSIHEGDKEDKIPDRSPASSFEDSQVDTKFQPGVQDVEAVTISWSKTSLAISYVLIWFVYALQGIVSGVSGSLLPYITSGFAEHSLTPTTSVISAVIGGVTNLTIAKVLDIFGRPQGYFVCIILTTVGLIMSAACNNVEAYAASQVFYIVGINGIGYSLSVFVADTTTLRNRALMQSICQSPYIITAWFAGPIATAFLNGPGWRWAFGMEAILTVVVTLPLFGFFMYHFMKAKKQHLVPKHSSGRTLLESAIYYLREFDAVGLLLLSAGVAFFLLPFNLYMLQAKGWSSPILIVFLVLGIVLLITFGIWERFFAKTSFIPWSILRDRTALGACFASFTLFLSNGCWGAYFTSFLQVVNGLSVTHASYCVQTMTVGSILFCIPAGAVVSYTGRYKPLALYVALPLTLLGSGLMIYFRQSDQNIGYIVMCQVFLAISGGAFMVTAEIAIMAAVVEHQYFAVSIAVLGMFSSVGTAIGYTISSAIWQKKFPESLAQHLPPDALPDLAVIYGDIMTQLSYAVGSETRVAIQHAYADAWKYLMIAATASWAIGVVSVLLWRNINVIGIKQTKGHVI